MDIYFIIALSIILFASSIVHGAIGFGFGMIATPLIAIYVDLQTTITFMLFPTMIANIISISSEGNFFEALKKYWLFITLMIIGSIGGTILLIHFNSEFFKLLLAFIIFIYLIQSLVKIRISFVSKYPKISTYILGLVGGAISGLTNVVAPLMIIYTLELNYSKKDTIQLSNLCFLFTKIGQIIVFLYYGAFSLNTLSISLYSIIFVLAGFYFGLKIRTKIDTKLYIKILKVLLFIIATVLVVETIR